MARKYIYDYYVIDLPGDLVDPEDKEWKKLMGEYAITEARERAKLYCIPALWTAELKKGEPGDFTVYFKVCRKRNRVVKAEAVTA